MPEFDWNDFSGLPTSPTQQFKFSERQQQFLLSLLVEAQSRSRWPDISDADWDIVEGFLSEIDVILMEKF